MRNIAEPYCNWTLDKGAKHAPILLISNLLVGISGAAFVATVVIAALSNTNGRPSPWFVATFLLFFFGVIAAGMVRSRASTAAILCSHCGKNMQRVQHNYPAELNLGMFASGSVIYGGNGRKYMQQGSSGKGGSMRWYRVMQELRVCKECKRYVVLEERKLILVGAKRADVEAYEARVENQKQRLAGKRFRMKQGR